MADIRDRDIRARASYDPRFDRVRPSAKKSQDTAKSKEKQGGDTKSSPTKPDTGPEVYRYPREALSDTTDALFISIYDQFRGEGGMTFNQDGLVQYVAEDPTKPKGKQIPKINLDKLGVPNASDFFQQNPNKIKKKNLKHIYLPIPQQISDSLQVSYGESSLDPLQAIGLGAVSATMNDPEQAIATGLDIGQALIKTNFSEGLDKSSQNSINAILSGKALNALGANVTANSVLARSSGQILQSNLELLFSGVTLRSFPFVFDFTPRDQVEAREVMSIIRCLKESMVPKKSSMPSVFIASPKVFQLEYVTGQTEHPFLNRFKICAMTQLSVNYTASGTYATYPDGTPVHIQVTCAFKELNPIYADDYEVTNSGPLANPDEAFQNYGPGGVGY